MTFADPSQECPEFSRGQPKSKLFGIHQGTQKHFQTFVPRDWSQDLQTGLLLKCLGIILIFAKSYESKVQVFKRFYVNVSLIISIFITRLYD